MLANKISLTYPSQHYTMHWSHFTSRRVPFEIRKYQSLQMPMWLNSWLENPISYENKRFIKSVLQCKLGCTGMKRLWHQYKGNFRCSWIVPDMWRPNGQRLITSGQSSDLSAKSISWHLLNASFSINYSNIMPDNYDKKSALRQSVPEAHLPNNFL